MPHTNQQSSQTHRIFTASKWSIFSEASARLFPPLVYIALAKLLTPDDFGIVAFASLAVGLAQILWDSGLSKAVIQIQGNVRHAANIVFFSNIALALITYGIILLLSRQIAAAFGDFRLDLVLRVQSLQILLGSLSSVHSALLQKDLAFKTLFKVRLFATLIPSFVSLSLAFCGYGYWALVVGSLVGEGAKAILFWRISTWRPCSRFDLSLAPALWRFGLWILGEELLAWFIAVGDSAIIGIYLGASDLGLYRVGTFIVLLFFGVLLEPIVPVVFSTLSRFQDDRSRLDSSLDVLSRFFAMTSLPLGICILALAGPCVELFLDEKWEDIKSVITWSSLNLGLACMINALPPAFRASGKVREFAIMRMLSAGYFVPIYLVSVKYGLQAFLCGRVAVTVLNIILYAIFSSHYLEYGLGRFLRNLFPGIFISIGGYLIVSMPALIITGPLTFLQQVVWVAVVVVLISFYIVFLSNDRRFFKEIINLSVKREQTSVP